MNIESHLLLSHNGLFIFRAYPQPWSAFLDGSSTSYPTSAIWFLLFRSKAKWPQAATQVNTEMRMHHGFRQETCRPSKALVEVINRGKIRKTAILHENRNCLPRSFCSRAGPSGKTLGKDLLRGLPSNHVATLQDLLRTVCRQTVRGST